MKKLELSNKLTRAFGKAGLKLKKHSPEILVVTGVIGAVTSAVLACKATAKATKIIEESKHDIGVIDDIVADPEKYKKDLPDGYTQKDHDNDRRIIKTKAAVNVAKTYAPAAVLGVLSITCIFAGTNILRKRNVALAAAYTTVDNSFKEYRNRVIERFGKDLDRELKYNIKSKEVEETVLDENGKEKTVKKTVNVVNSDNGVSEYARFYDDGCKGWQKDSEHNLWMLTRFQNMANDKLKSEGYIFLNDVYEMLGIPKTKAGQIVGWVYNEKNPSGDNYVDFGIYNVHDEAKRDFVNGYERSILLDFNVDGNILDLI